MRTRMGRTGIGARLVLAFVSMALSVAGTACNSDKDDLASGQAPSTMVTSTPAAPTTVAPTTSPPTTSAPTTLATTTTLGRQRIDLLSALDAGLVEASSRGNGLQSVSLELTSKAGHPLEIVVEPGTIFGAQTGGVQSMVSRASRTVSLQPGTSTTTTVQAACANMYLDTPSSSTSFSITGSGNADLNSLLALSGFANEPFRVAQFAAGS